jgi:hypothetical protein
MYHSWVYIHIINTPWFMWTIVSITFGFNFLLPLIVWYVFSSRRPRIPFFLKRNKHKPS